MSSLKQYKTYETEILIVGGGWAGVFAALSINDLGSRVMIAEKSPSIKRSGGLGPGIADIGLPVYPDGSTSDELIRYYVMDILDATEYMADPHVLQAFAENGPRMLNYIEQMGIEYDRDDKGLLVMQPGKGQYPQRPYEIFFKDANTVKPRICQYLLKRKMTEVVACCMITRLLVDEGRISGAVGINTRTGEIVVFKSKVIILTTGPGHRTYLHPTGIFWNSWNCPYNTFDGLVAAYEAGAELTGMEFTEPTIFPKDIAVPGTNPWLASGGYIINAKGERIMPKYDHRVENAPRARITWAITREVEAGNGPIYLDLRHLPEQKIQKLYEVLHGERPSLDLYFSSRGLDYRETPIEIEVGERTGHQGGVSGIIINPKAETNVGGLLAAGDIVGTAGTDAGGIPCADGVVMGNIAGKTAVEAAGRLGFGKIDEKQVDLERKRIEAPLKKKAGLPWLPFNEKIANIMGNYVNYPRNGSGLARGLERLENLRGEIDNLSANTVREQFHCLEVSNILDSGLLSARSALERKESRLGIEHFRSDYPFRDDANWIKFVVVKKGKDGNIDASTREIERLYWGHQQIKKGE